MYLLRPHALAVAPRAAHRYRAWAPTSAVESLFDDIFSPSVWGSHTEAADQRLISPRSETADTPEAHLVRVEVPGIREEDLNVTLDQGVLKIEGKHRRERLDGSTNAGKSTAEQSFRLQYTLPGTVDGDGVKASLDHGLLTVTVPKTPRPPPRAVAISTTPHSVAPVHEAGPEPSASQVGNTDDINRDNE